MNDEIKEILKEIECYRNEELCLIFLSRKESNALLDYINNLQQENERLKENNQEMQEEMARVWEENERLKEELVKIPRAKMEYDLELEDYKYRCEKAIDKLGKYKHYSTPTEEQNSENEDIVDSVLNILQNGDGNN